MSNSALLILLLGWFITTTAPDGRTASVEKRESAAIIAAPTSSELGRTQEVRVLHIGDSHIQADFFTGEVRRLLRDYLKDTCPQRGFVFPFSIAGSNNPLDFKSTSTGSWETSKSTDMRDSTVFGINGIVLKTKDITSTVTLKLKSEKNRFNKVRIFYASSRHITPTVTGNFSISKSTVNKESGFVDYMLSTKVDSITIALKGIPNSGEFVLHGVFMQDTESTFSYNVVGLNGASTTSFLRCNRLSADIKGINPTHVIISLGTNDAYSASFSPQDLRTNLETIVRRVRESVPFATIILTTPGDFLAKGGKATIAPKIASEIIAYVAEENNCIVWNFFAQMGGEGSIEEWYKQGLAAPDRLHLSKDGYKVQGRMFFEWLTNINS